MSIVCTLVFLDVAEVQADSELINPQNNHGAGYHAPIQDLITSQLNSKLFLDKKTYAAISTQIQSSVIQIGLKYKDANGWELLGGSGFFIEGSNCLELHTAEHVITWARYFQSLPVSDENRNKFACDPIVLTSPAGKRIKIETDDLIFEPADRDKDHAIVRFRSHQDELRSLFHIFKVAKERPRFDEMIYLVGFPGNFRYMILPNSMTSASRISAFTKLRIVPAKAAICVTEEKLNDAKSNLSGDELESRLEEHLGPYLRNYGGDLLVAPVPTAGDLHGPASKSYDLTSVWDFASFCATSSGVAPGMSGGPALNGIGEVVGETTTIMSHEGYGPENPKFMDKQLTEMVDLTGI